MTATDALARDAAALLRADAPALLRHEASETGPDSPRVFLAARHDVVVAMLCDEDRFSLIHYDLLLEQVAPGTRYLVGENDANRHIRLALLHAAQAHADAVRQAPPDPGPPNLAPGLRGHVATIVREEAGRILDVLAHRAETAEPVNFVRDYAFLLAYRMARRIVGVPGPARPPALVRLIVALRNAIRPGPWVRLRGEQGLAATTLTALHPLFGHVFGTVTTSPGWMQAATRATTAPALDAFDAALALPGLGPPDSLVAAMHAIRPQFPAVSDANFHLQARSVLFELAGALILIVGKSLSEIAAFAASDAGEAAGIDWPGLIATLAAPDRTQADHDATINEMLRLGGGNRLVRTVRVDGPWRGIDLRAGDRILLLIDAASHDPAAFPQPHLFQPAPQRAYITSGPLQGPHVCYGRAIAWTILREAILATAGRIAPTNGAALASFGGLPDDLAFLAVPRSAPEATLGTAGRPEPAVHADQSTVSATIAAGKVPLGILKGRIT